MPNEYVALTRLRPVVTVSQCYDDLGSLITPSESVSMSGSSAQDVWLDLFRCRPYPAPCLILGGECFVYFSFLTSQDTSLTSSAFTGAVYIDRGR